MDASWSRYCLERLKWLDTSHPQQADPASGAPPAPAATTAPPDDRAVLQAGSRSMLPLEDLLPVFSYIVVRSSVDRPLLCAALAGAWLQQQGLTSGRDGLALSLFRVACLWAAALPEVPAA